MKPLNPIELERAFVREDCPMFSELIEKLTNEVFAKPERKRDMISGLTRVAKALGRSESDTPADPRWLQPRLSKVAPAKLGLSPKSWQNTLSNARAAMAHFGIVERRHRSRRDLSPEWRCLWDRVLSSRDRTLPSLCRFIHFLSRQGVKPKDVSDADADAYLHAVTLSEISKSPETAYRAAVNNWNLAAKRIPGWPQVTLKLPNRQKKIARSEATYPDSFLRELTDILQRLERPNPLDTEGNQRPLRAQTLVQYRAQILRFAGELMDAGMRAKDITSVLTLLDPAVAERGLRHMLKRTDNQTTRSIADMAGLLRNLARILNVDAGTRAQLAHLAKRLKMPSAKGMTRKNRDRLRVLQDPATLQKLLLLPDRLFTVARGYSRPHTRALANEDALAIAILLYCPVRIKNVAGIHLDRNIQRPGKGRVYLVLSDEETKTRQPIEFELPPDLVRMLDKHLASRSPELCPAGTPWLFPRRDGSGPIDPNPLSNRLRKRIRRETGLEVNAHLFRHLAVMLWLEAHPGEYEAARRLLGHSDVSHTINLYSGLETRTAMDAFADMISTKRGRLR